MNAEQMKIPEKHASPFARAVIVGMGQTGRMFYEQLLPVSGMDAIGIKRSGWADLEAHHPDLIIAATPNPADEVLKKLAETVREGTTIILPQNGVSVIQVAEQIFPPEHRVHLVRASLLTPVSTDEDGRIRYRPEKKTISFAPIHDDPNAAERAAELFSLAGFRTRVYEDARAMEITKLLLNTIGATSTVTGLTPLETFHDEELFSLEMHGLMDRLAVLHRAGKELINFPGYPYVKALDELAGMLQHAPGVMREDMLPALASLFRDRIASMIAGGRSNLPSASFRSIRHGKKTEVRYYHQPFIHLAETNGGGCPLDESILEIVSGHEKGKLNLNEMDIPERRQLLLDTYRAHIHAEKA